MQPLDVDEKNNQNPAFGFETGPIRPPSEATSLLLRVTRNCPWNRCKFCGVYKGSRFSVRSVEEVKADIDAMAHYRDLLFSCMGKDGKPDRKAMLRTIQQADELTREQMYQLLNWILNGKGESVFLQDANSIVLKPERLAEILRYLRKVFPGIKRVTSYGRADTLARLSVEDLRLLRQAGLDRIHSGYESGSDQVLERIGKGCSKQQEIEGGLKTKEAGLELSLYFMPGVGGKALSEENARESADVINRVDPDFVRIRTFVAKPGTELGSQVESGQMAPCTDQEKAAELRLMLEQIHGCRGVLVSDHIVNLLESVNGSLAQDREWMIGQIQRFENMSFDEKREFQLARRMGLVRRPEDVKRLSPQVRKEIHLLMQKTQESDQWERLMNYFLQQYI